MIPRNEPRSVSFDTPWKEAFGRVICKRRLRYTASAEIQVTTADSRPQDGSKRHATVRDLKASMYCMKHMGPISWVLESSDGPPLALRRVVSRARLILILDLTSTKCGTTWEPNVLLLRAY